MIDWENIRLKELAGYVSEEFRKRGVDVILVGGAYVTAEMKAHVNADETCLITAKTVLDLAKRAKELFESSKLSKKQQLLNLVLSNLKFDGKKLLVTSREPFLTLCAMSHQPANLRKKDSNLRPTD